MEDILVIRNGFGFPPGNPWTQRKGDLFYDKATATERWRIQDLILSVNHALARMEKDPAQMAPEKDRIKPTGSREKPFTSSLKTLLFRTRMLEKENADYASRVPVETEFRVRVRRLRRRVSLRFKSFNSN